MGARRDRRVWCIGVDLGGTWVRAIARDTRGRSRRFTAPSPGLEALPALLRRLWGRWRLARARVPALVVASRGVWTASERRRHARRLGSLARRVVVISDAEAAYVAALGDGAGILLLAGTGSMALARDARGRWARAGGWGPLLGDEGSAFWIGREWLRASKDGRGFATARRLLASPRAVAGIAALAPAVLRRAREGSAPARRIVAAAHTALADLIVAVSAELDLPAPTAVSWGGRLLADPGFRSGVWRAARRRGLAVRPRAPRESAVAAATRIALQLPP